MTTTKQFSFLDHRFDTEQLIISACVMLGVALVIIFRDLLIPLAKIMLYQPVALSTAKPVELENERIIDLLNNYSQEVPSPATRNRPKGFL